MHEQSTSDGVDLELTGRAGVTLHAGLPLQVVSPGSFRWIMKEQLLQLKNKSVLQREVLVARAAKNPIPRVWHQSWSGCVVPRRQRAWQAH